MKRTPVASGKEKILVVNHDREGLLFTQQLLESADFLVETSLSCSDAVQRMENGEAPALILLEDAQPEEAMKTIQACRRLRPEQKIVVFSEISDVSTVVQAVRLGALDYIAKPLDGSKLIAEVQRLLGPAKAAAEPSQQECPREHFEAVENDIFFLAASPAMQKIRSQVEQVAKVYPCASAGRKRRGQRSSCAPGP